VARACFANLRACLALGVASPFPRDYRAGAVFCDDEEQVSDDRRDASRLARRQPRVRVLAIMAAAVVLGWALLFWSAQAPGFTAGLLADHRTGIGEHRTVLLPEGSTAALGADSALSVTYGARVRRVRLHHGEAFFTVAEDPRRPFVVEAAGGRLATDDAAFNAKVADSAVEIAVAVGTVEVRFGSSPPARLGPGQSLRGDAAAIGMPRAGDPGEAGLWRQGRLVFRQAPLGAVLRDLDRYRRGRIVLTDQRLASLLVTAAFDTHQPDAALDALARMLPVRLVRLTGLLVLVRPLD
jgi:transmembrane sensor